MAAPRFRLPRTSTVRMEAQTGRDVARLLLLIALLRLNCRDRADLIRLYRKWRNRASVFFDACLSGDIVPFANQFQDELNALIPVSYIAHLYLPGWGCAKPAYYASLIKGEDGLWRLRHRRLRRVPGAPARDGILILWGNVTPSPDVAVAWEPTLERVLTGGVSCADFGAEAQTSFEVRRQLSHAVIVAQVFDALHHDKLVTQHDPGKVILHVNTSVGDGWVHPHEFQTLAVRPYAPACDQKARVTIWANMSDKGLYATQTPRCILPSVKEATAYPREPEDRTEAKLLAELLLSRLLPLIGVLRPDRTVDIYGLHYDANLGRGGVAKFATRLPLRSCKGLPLVRLGQDENRRCAWVPNSALISILRGLIYDPTPDADARADRWHSLCMVMRWMGVNTPQDHITYFAEHGLPLPNGAEQHIGNIIAQRQNI